MRSDLRRRTYSEIYPAVSRDVDGLTRLFRQFATPGGIPSHDTFGRIFAMLDPAAFERCFTSWVNKLSESCAGKLVSLDGKSIRRSFEHAWDSSGMAHLVSAFVAENRLVLGQLAVDKADHPDAHGNEITVLPQLLSLLDLQGATVSIDAIGCQRSVAQQVVEKQADYVLCVKENQPTLREKVKRLLDEAIAEGTSGQMPLAHVQEVDGGHGRIETRDVWVSDQVRHLPEAIAEQWAGLKIIACVQRRREIIGGKTSIERSYYISSIAQADAGRLAGMIRGHWGIENQLHWHLDVSFGEDACRIRKDNAAENFSRLRRIALNQLQRERTLKGGIKTKRLKAGWDHPYLLKVLAA